MHIDKFEMERMQCTFEHAVDYNLSESGVLPYKIGELLESQDELENFLESKLSYCESDGSPLLRERIAKMYPDCDPSNITVTNGGAEANYVTLWTLLNKNNRLSVMVPNYMQSWGLGKAFAEAADVFYLIQQENNGVKRWGLDVDEFKRSINSNTEVILITNPNNPTGAVLTEEEMEVIVETAREADAWLIADEIYRGAEVEGEMTPTFWGRYEKVIITSGLSKAFALPGLRIGWIVAPRELIEEVWVRHDYLTLTPGLLNDRVATLALEPSRREAIITRTREIIRTNLPLLEDWFKQHDHYRYISPVAGAITYFEYDSAVSSTELIYKSMEEKSVLLVPGDQLGLDRGVRVGFGYDIQKTITGLSRMDEVYKEIEQGAFARMS